MASEAVKRILEAEAEADKRSAEARAKADSIVTEAERKASITVQKRLTDAKTETGKLRDENRRRLEEYTNKAEEDCAAKLAELEKTAASNSDKAVEAIISGFFS